MKYSEILDYLYNQLPMFHRVGPAAYKANLNNTLALSKHFNYPEHNFKAIHIAGTNGKGSTAHIIASVLQEKGLKTGLCTSPHLVDFRERVKINGEMISKEYICEFVNNNFKFFNEINPSFFELTIALTFKYFSDQKIDIAVVETGMGGRLDSTNIIKPLISIITNISLDHTNLLGTNIKQIAQEKAGIIKPNAPAIIGQTQHSISKIFSDKAHNNNSPIYFADQNYKVTPISDNKEKHISQYNYDVINKFGNKNTLKAGLGGNYQANNIATALQCFELLNSHHQINILEEQVKNGLKNIIKNTGLKGRWQIIGKQPLTICDTGHNTEAIKLIVDNLKKLPYKKLHIVIGMMNDKNIEDILLLLPNDALYYFTNAQTPRAIKSETLKDKAKQFNLKGNGFNTVKKALNNARINAEKDDIIFIGGSNFVVAEVI